MKTNEHFWPYLGSFLLWIRNVSDKSHREHQNTHFTFSNFFCFSKITQYCRNWQAKDGNTMWHTRITCWITKATNTHSEYVTLTDFLLQQWLHECNSILHYMHTACRILTYWKVLKYQFSWKSAEWKPSCYTWTDGQMDGQTDRQTERQTTAKLIVNFCNLVNMPKRIFTSGTHYTDSSKYVTYLPDTWIKPYI